MAVGDDVNNGAPKSFHVVGGDGNDGYSKNSEFQKKLVDLSKDMIKEVIGEHFDSDFYSKLRIADYGCSVGPNAFSAVQNIIDAVDHKQKQNSLNQTEFLIFLNDLIENDFNTLFKYIPHNKNYFVSAVPGSFYGRLLPEASVEIGHCSTALHWLSHIPEEVTDKNSPAWNGGKVDYSGASEEVRAAYSNQFRKDMEVFYGARANEIVEGGLLILIVIGNQEPSPNSNGAGDKNFEVLTACLEDMVEMGIITKEKLDLFNIPFYFPSPSELVSSMEANGCFEVIKFETMEIKKKSGASVKDAASHFRAVVSGHVSDHFGPEIVDQVFQLFTEKFSKESGLSYDNFRKMESIVFLKRNGKDC